MKMTVVVSKNGCCGCLVVMTLLWGLAVYADTTSSSSHRFHASVLAGTTTIKDQKDHDSISEKNNSTMASSSHRSQSIPSQLWDVVSSIIKSSKKPALTTQRACRSYLAPSSLPGAGLGMFAGTDFREGDHVTVGDAVVPLLDVDWNNYYKNNKNFLWDDYIWSGSTFPGMTEPTQYDIDGASFGIGAIPNCHFGLLNLEETKIKRDTAGVDRHSPGIGSFTPFYDRISYATHEIVAGSELFVDYGYGYFKGSRTKTIGFIPFLDDFETADALLVKFDRLWNRTMYHHRHELRFNHNTCKSVSAVGEFEASTENEDCAAAVKVFEDIHQDIFQTAKKILSAWPTRITMALPDSVEDIPALREAGGTAKKDYNRSIRSIEYLEEYGSCMDNVVVKPSAIPDAGRGAFATRNLAKGSVVAPIPLIHLPERSVLQVHSWGNYDPDDGENFHGELIHQQLLLNYCFGHDNTTMVLCPYGVGSSLINHGGKEKANVKVVWSEKTMVHPEWLDKPIKEWAFTSGSGLCFDYIATRDIPDGEEILLDYGDDWQRAWDQHVVTWEPVERLTDRLNADLDGLIPTEKEWKYSMGNPNDDPNAVTLWCYSAYRLIQGLPPAKNKAYPCKVIARNDDGTYLAEVVMHMQNEKADQCETAFDEALWAIPRDALAYGGPFEVDDTREQWNPKTFRHHIGVPDHLLPLAWQNNVPKAT